MSRRSSCTCRPEVCDNRWATEGQPCCANCGHAPQRRVDGHVCTWCTAKVHAGTYLCRKCIKTLDYALRNTGAYYADLETLRTHLKATRYDTGGGTGGRKEQPLGVDLRFVAPGYETCDEVKVLVEGRATIAEAKVRTTALKWMRRVLHTWKDLTPPRNYVPAVCEELASMTSAIAGQPWAGDMLRDFSAAEHTLKPFVDIPPAKVYLGICPGCEGSVYAIEGEPTGKCSGCGTSYDVETSRRALNDALDDQLLTAAEIATVSTYLDLPVDREKVRARVNQWHARGRIKPAATDEQGNPRFRYRDVRVLLYTDFARPVSA